MVSEMRRLAMRVFDRGAELIGDERVKEIEEAVWYKEMLTVEAVFGMNEYDETLAADADDEDEVSAWSNVDGREVGMYWEQNDGIGSKEKFEKRRVLVKEKDGWSEWDEKAWMWKRVEVKCGEMFDAYGVCECNKCLVRDRVGRQAVVAMEAKQ
jgi:hypothetical protein